MRNHFSVMVLCTLLLVGCTKQAIQAPTPSVSPVSTPQATSTPTSDISPSPKLTSIVSSHLSTTKSPTPQPTPTSSKLTIHSLPSAFGDDNTREIKTVDTIVIHSLYNPNSRTPFDPHACKDILDESEVSTHYLIDRTGEIWNLVPENHMAWHAGVSQMPSPDGRSKVNSFSIGIELIGNKTSGFTAAQYEALNNLLVDVMMRLPIQFITGHSDIAPDRKTDPWNFDWNQFERSLPSPVKQKVTVFHTNE